jgi:hypothetical protein
MLLSEYCFQLGNRIQNGKYYSDYKINTILNICSSRVNYSSLPNGFIKNKCPNTIIWVGL